MGRHINYFQFCFVPKLQIYARTDISYQRRRASTVVLLVQAISARGQILKGQPKEVGVGKVSLITQVLLNGISKEHSFPTLFLQLLFIFNLGILHTIKYVNVFTEQCCVFTVGSDEHQYLNNIFGYEFIWFRGYQICSLMRVLGC